MPRCLALMLLDMVSLKHTLAFSNTPGPLKPFKYKGKDGTIIRNLHSQSYLMVSGYIGLALNCVSQSGTLRLSLQSDDIVMNQSENRKFMMFMYNNIVNEIAKHVSPSDDSQSQSTESKKEQ